MNSHICHREERSDVAIHLEFSVDCRSRQGSFAMTNKGVFISRSAATKQSSWNLLERVTMPKSVASTTRAMGNTYWVYILASQRNGTLYVGVTNSLQRRIWQHRNGETHSFTKRHRVNRLVYFEPFRDISNAIAREKQIKGGSRKKKIALIEQENVEWHDLSEGWLD